MPLDLAVAMLVREPPIERLVALVDFMSAIASEVVIVDTGSCDADVQAMARMNKAPWGLPKVLVLKREWRDDFAWARNEGLDRVTRKWTLVLDPDEIPSMKMMEHIEDVVTANGSDTFLGNSDGWLYWTKDFYGGRQDPPAEYQWHVRLFRTGVGRFYRPLDELVSLGGTPEHDTRGTPRLPKAPKEAYLIHSKDSDAASRSRELYERMRTEQNLSY